MLNMKEAVIKAKEYAQNLYEGENIKDLGLEEISFNENDSAWLVTLGYNIKRDEIENNALPKFQLGIESLTAFNKPIKYDHQIIREYKIFEINSNNGELIKMTIRNI